MLTISLNKIKIYAYHGCLDEEKKCGQIYFVDIKLFLPKIQALKNDQLSETIDYVLINQIVTEQMHIYSNLIEHVSFRIGKEILKRTTVIRKISVKITKPNPPIGNNFTKAVSTKVILNKDEIN